MEEFFFYKYNEQVSFKADGTLEGRPRVLGLTASPLKQKVGDGVDYDITCLIQDKLQLLANNLYSKFVFIQPDYV